MALNGVQGSDEFQREFTGLDGAQADALRIFINKTNREAGAPVMRIPRDSWEFARMYYELVAKVPVPAHILARTGRSTDVPRATPNALALCTEFRLDPRSIPGTGENGSITVEDVRKVLEANLAAMEVEIGKAKKKPKYAGDKIEVATPPTDKESERLFTGKV